MQSPIVAQNSPARSPHILATPQSRKRRRINNQESVVKNVRFALDEDNHRPEQTTTTTTTAAIISAVDEDAIPQSRFSGGEFVHPDNFQKVSPKKSTAEVLNTLVVCSSPNGQPTTTRLGFHTPSPLILTPRRSAMKRRLIDEAGQRPPTDSACTTPTDFRSPTVSNLMGRRKTLEQTDECLYPPLRFSNHSINQLCLQLAETTRQRNLASYLKENGITKIGEFASLSPTKLEQIPYLKRPKVDNALNFLRNFAQNMSSQQTATNGFGDSNAAPVVNVDSSEKESTSPVEVLSPGQPQEDLQADRDDSPIPPQNTTENNQVNAEPNHNAGGTLDTMEIVKESPPNEIEEQNQQPRGVSFVQRTQAPVATSSQQSGTVSSWVESNSDINIARFTHELQEKAADLSNLINTTISAISKPKLKPVKMIREIRAHFRDASVSKDECDQMLDLIMDLAKDVNQRRRALDDS